MTPVYGATRLLADVRALGHTAELMTASNGQTFVVISGYDIELGRFAGRKVGLGLQTTADFPKTVASAIHVCAHPQLYEQKDSVANVRNIQASALGESWRYWSHNFGWSGEKTARRLLSQVNQIFKDA